MSDTEVLEPFLCDAVPASRHQIGDLTFTTGPLVIRDGHEIFLSEKEFALLHYLADHLGKVVPRAEISAHLYPDHPASSGNLVDVLVMRLRRKLSPHGETDLILTHRGAGYQISADDPAASPAPHISLISRKLRATRRWRRGTH